MVKSFSSDTELNSSKLPVLPQYILTALYDRRIPEDIVNEIHENPYLVESLTRRFSKFEDFARWMGKWGVRDGSDIGRMLVVKPKLLKAKLVAMDETVTVYRKELQIPDDQVGKLFVQNPSLLLFTKEDLFSIFRSFEEVGYARKHFRKFLLENPALITPDIQTRLENVAEWITREVGLKVLKVKKALDRSPDILNRTRQELNAYIDYFEQHLEMEKTRISSMLRMNPRWISLDLERSIVPKTRYFISEFGLTHKEVGRIIGMQPGLLVRPIENTRSARDVLLSNGFSADDLKIIMNQAPSAFFIHAERSLRPLLEFILHVMKRTTTDVVNFPYCLTYPIEHFMLRVDFLGPHGQCKIILKQVLKPPDHIFAEIVAKSKRTTYGTHKASWNVPKEWEKYILSKGKNADFDDSDDEDDATDLL